MIAASIAVFTNAAIADTVLCTLLAALAVIALTIAASYTLTTTPTLAKTAVTLTMLCTRSAMAHAAITRTVLRAYITARAFITLIRTLVRTFRAFWFAWHTLCPPFSYTLQLQTITSNYRWQILKPLCLLAYNAQ